MKSTKNEAKHTPGPWTMDYNVNRGRNIYGGPELRAQDKHTDHPSAEAHIIHRTVAVIPHTADDRMNQDARLIAAAPELLEILKWARTQLGYSNRTNCNGKYCDQIDAIDAAIAKAEGK